MWQVYKGWKPIVAKLEQVLQDEDRTSTPLQIIRIVLGLIINTAVIIWGILVDPNMYTFILIACLINMACYFVNYIVTKVQYLVIFSTSDRATVQVATVISYFLNSKLQTYYRYI